MANVILKDEYSSTSEKNSKTIQLVIDIFDKIIGFYHSDAL